MVEINDMLFTRSEDGTLIAQEVELENLPDKPKVKIVPLTRGKLQEVYALSNSSNIEDKTKSDLMVIQSGLIEPKLNDEQIADLKPKWANAITMAVLAISLDMPQSDIKYKADELIASQEAELKKK